MRMKPETREQIEPMLADLNKQWEDLETTTKEKGEKLFDANRSVLYEQSCDDIDGWVTALESQIITSEDFGKDLTTVNLQVQKQNVSGLFGFEFLIRAVLVLGQDSGRDLERRQSASYDTEC